MKKHTTILLTLLGIASVATWSLFATNPQASTAHTKPRTSSTPRSGKLVLLASPSRTTHRPNPVRQVHNTCHNPQCACHSSNDSKQPKSSSNRTLPDWNNRQFLVAMEKGLGRTTDGGIEGLSMVEDFDPSLNGSIKDRESIQRLEEMVASRMGQDLDWELLMEDDNRLE